MKTLLLSILGALVAGFLLGVLLTCPAKATPQAAPTVTPHQAAGQAATTSGDTYQTQAEGFLKDLSTLKGQIAARDKRIAELEAAAPAIKPGETDPCPELRSLSASQGEQIQDQAQALTICEQRGTALEQEAAARGKAASAYSQEAQQLRASIEANPPRPWAAGVFYGTDGQMGVTGEYDWNRLRVGVDVVRHPTNSGTTLEAVGRFLVRF